MCSIRRFGFVPARHCGDDASGCSTLCSRRTCAHLQRANSACCSEIAPKVGGQFHDILARQMKRVKSFLGVLATPLPMVVCLLAFMAILDEPLETGFILFVAALTTVAIWLFILVSKIILYLVGWQSLRAHLVVMFVLTLAPQVLWSIVWSDVEYETDLTFSYQVNESSTQTIDLAVGGYIAMAILSAVGALCMWVFWTLFSRDKKGTTNA